MRSNVRGEVCGVQLKSLVEPTREVLKMYSGQTDGRVGFDLVRAARLELTPNRSNSARSETPVTFENGEAGTLCTIAFAPGDGTGDDRTFPNGSLLMGYCNLPNETRYYPRAKKGVFAELQFPLVAARIDDARGKITQGGELGVLTVADTPGYGAVVAHTGRLPYRGGGRANLTTGYTDEGVRFGDPHAIFSPLSAESVVVCSFLAIFDREASRLEPMMQALNARQFVQF